MENRDILLREVRTRIQEISARLDGELQELESQGVITRLDKQKLWADATTSAQSVLNALNRGDFPQEMQRELVNRLIIQFEDSAAKILARARTRLYSPERIERRLHDIEISVLSRFGPYVERRVRATPSIIGQLHDEFLRALRASLKKQSLDYSLVESQFQQYEQMLTRLVEEQLPKLAAPQEGSVTVHPEIKIEKPPDKVGEQQQPVDSERKDAIRSEKKRRRIPFWPFK